MKRVIYTFATGQRRYAAMAKAMARSLVIQGSRTHRLLLTDLPAAPDLARLFDEVIGPDPKFPFWYAKLAACELTDADAVMFVDSDCLAVRNPDGLFERLEGKKFCVQGDWREEDWWYGDFARARRHAGVGAAPVFNGGWMYYERCPETDEIIEQTLAFFADYDKLGTDLLYNMPPEEVCVSLALAKTGYGEVLDAEWNISSTPNYMIGRAHLDVLRGECTLVEGRYRPQVCKPVFYHSAMARYDWRFWYQAWRVTRALEKYKGWPRPKEWIAVKVWRRLVWGATVAFVWATGLLRGR